MIIIANDDASPENAQAALETIQSWRWRRTFSVRPNMDDSHWVKTLWADEKYL